jgi:methylmalonyl-CoA mutase cobalamin-binding domain/chain
MGLRQVQRVTTVRAANSPKKPLKILMGVIEGDTHDMGKNVIRDVFKGYGYEVLDLGKNVPASSFAEAAQSQQTDIAGLSTMMSTTIEAMKKTIESLRAARPGIRILIGGAFIDRQLATQLQADGYAEDAAAVMAEFNRIIQ